MAHTQIEKNKEGDERTDDDDVDDVNAFYKIARIYIYIVHTYMYKMAYTKIEKLKMV